MDIMAAKMIGAGMCMIALLGVGIGLGNMFASFISSIARNPGAKDQIFTVGMIGFAATEIIAIFALFIALLILFMKF
jgi:F-type H+-transporting ATPase subunit c